MGPEMGKVEITDVVEQIRSRPGMYVGATDVDGVHHMLYWVLDDLLDNARAGRGQRIDLGVVDGEIRVWDDGPALPPSKPGDGEPLDRMDRMSSSFEGVPGRGVASPEQVRSYLVVLRALSSSMRVEFMQAGLRHVRTYRRGAPVDRSVVAAAQLDAEHPGMTFKVTFEPDPEIFTETEVSHEHLERRLRTLAATCPQVEIGYLHSIWTRPLGVYRRVAMPNGMADIVREVVKTGLAYPERPFRLRVHEGEFAFDVALQWREPALASDSHDGPQILAWGNTVHTREGAHVLGLREALRDAGLDGVPCVAALSVFVPQPRYSSPVKDRLLSPGIRRLVREHLATALRRLAENDDFALTIDRLRRTETRQG